MKPFIILNSMLIFLVTFDYTSITCLCYRLVNSFELHALSLIASLCFSHGVLGFWGFGPLSLFRIHCLCVEMAQLFIQSDSEGRRQEKK